MPESPDDILTLTEAAAALGVTRARVSQWLQAGRAPAVREQRIVGIRRGDLATLAAKRRPVGKPRGESAGSREDSRMASQISQERIEAEIARIRADIALEPEIAVYDATHAAASQLVAHLDEESQMGEYQRVEIIMADALADIAARQADNAWERTGPRGLK